MNDILYLYQTMCGAPSLVGHRCGHWQFHLKVHLQKMSDL